MDNSETYSISESNPLSVKQETKQKFEALLKLAKHKTRHDSKETLLKDTNLQDFSNDNQAFVNDDDNENKTYIMNKFLNYNETFGEISRLGQEKPVPKPRKLKKNVEERRSSITSQRTFEVTSPKIVHSPTDSLMSNRTFNVEEIGDVLLHTTPSKQKVVVQKQHENFDAKSTDSISEQSKSHQVEIRSSTNQNIDEIQDTEIKKRYNYEEIMEVIIHNTYRLKNDPLIIHPMVKFHIVDIEDGKYLKKSNQSRSVVFFYENPDFDYISPVLTHAYNLRENHSLKPCWEETILINEDFNYFVDNIDRIIFFFEIIDFIPVSQIEHTKGWHHIAFAFLKPTKENQVLSTQKQLRLQLYDSGPQSKKTENQICPIWLLWRKKKFSKYPSTISITIKSVKTPNIGGGGEVLRSKTPIQKEKIGDFCDIREDNNKIVSNVDETAQKSNKTIEDIVQKKRFNETTNIPNKCIAKFNPFKEGCFILKFSNNGLYLACSVKIEDFYHIIIVSVVDLKEIKNISCHQGLIHWIRWTDDDRLLLTSSADNTVAIHDWQQTKCLQILPHPSFVYSNDIKDTEIITGGFDGVVRIWIHSDDYQKIDLFQELEGHRGYITAVSLSKKGYLYSTDSKGVIIEWEKQNEWLLRREIKILELRDTVINGIRFLPKFKRIVIHARDSLIRIMDLKSTCILQRLDGGLNNKVQIFSSLSPCGKFYSTGSEDGFIYTWNIKSGEIISKLSPFNENSSDNTHLTIHCIDYHPFSDMFAISHYGNNNLPIMIYGYEKTNVDDEQHDINTKITNKISCSSNRNSIRINEKIDFQQILQKMDDLIATK